MSDAKNATLNERPERVSRETERADTTPDHVTQNENRRGTHTKEDQEGPFLRHEGEGGLELNGTRPK